MSEKLSLRNSLDIVAALIAALAFIGVLQSFLIGKHFIIPTMILFFGILVGNLARYGFRGYAWAKHILFCIFTIFTAQTFFALFWAKNTGNYSVTRSSMFVAEFFWCSRFYYSNTPKKKNSKLVVHQYELVEPRA